MPSVSLWACRSKGPYRSPRWPLRGDVVWGLCLSSFFVVFLWGAYIGSQLAMRLGGTASRNPHSCALIGPLKSLLMHLQVTGLARFDDWFARPTFCKGLIFFQCLDWAVLVLQKSSWCTCNWKLKNCQIYKCVPNDETMTVFGEAGMLRSSAVTQTRTHFFFLVFVVDLWCLNHFSSEVFWWICKGKLQRRFLVNNGRPWEDAPGCHPSEKQWLTVTLYACRCRILKILTFLNRGLLHRLWCCGYVGHYAASCAGTKISLLTADRARILSEILWIKWIECVVRL